jgi:hypothetical protein
MGRSDALLGKKVLLVVLLVVLLLLWVVVITMRSMPAMDLLVIAGVVMAAVDTHEWHRRVHF